MEKIVKPIRLCVLFIFIALLVVIYFVALYKLQIIDGKAYYEESMNNRTSEEDVAAARGSIMDRYGRVLVTNRPCNNLVINLSEMFTDEDKDYSKANANILRLCRLVKEYGDTYTDTLPITMTAPFEYTEMSEIQRAFLNAYLADKDLPTNTSAVELMAFMRERYNIDPSYTSEEGRIIVGVRYEINGRYSENFSTSPYIFAEDVSMELITLLMESGIQGFDVDTSFVREYNTSYASHILGYIGMMTADEYRTYKTLDYGYNAQVGKSGVELSFEKYLHGDDGKARVTTTATGVTTSTVYLEEPKPGSHVYLTIDIGLQEAAENALNSYITTENQRRQAVNDELDLYGGNEEDYQPLITGGAAVAVDVHTGEPLAIASWPSYELTGFLENYNEILEMENNPLYNRALQGAYAPGSTFKPVVAIAGLNEGKIDLGTKIKCEGIFTKYKDAGYTPTCWIYGEGLHPELDVAGALTVSCNYFFFNVADALQISLMVKYAKAYGLGQHTGIELYEETGVLASDEYMQSVAGRDMYAGDTLAAGIGQSVHLFTPLQMAEYCAALANNGTRYSASILKSVRSYDYSETIYEREAEVLSEVDVDQAYYDVVHQGMRGVVADVVNTTVYTTFMDTPYSLAAKTGTAETGYDNEYYNNGFFICYAPYDDPQIAIAVAVERAGAGSSTGPVAKDMLDYYFSFVDSTMALEGESALLK